MNVPNQGTEINFNNWAIAYTAQQPGMLAGFIGYVEEIKGNYVKLSQACEIISVTQQVDKNRMARIHQGAPIEFTQITEVEVWCVALVRLSNKMHENDKQVFSNMLKHVAELRKSILPDQPRIALASNIPPMRR